MKYDESDHIVVRATRTFTDKFTELFGNYKFILCNFIYVLLQLFLLLYYHEFLASEWCKFHSFVAGGVFSKTEMSEVLTEVIKMDPTFDKEQFVKDCRDDIIPNVLEVCILITFPELFWHFHD